MNRITFMQELESLLSDVPKNEREEALQFYNDYFDDAGKEHESKVIEELESPGKVAFIIKSELKGGTGGEGEFTERGYEDTRFKDNFEISRDRRESDSNRSSKKEGPENNKAGKIILIIILCVLAIPVGAPLIASAFGIVLGIAGVLLSIVISFAAIAIALVVSGIVVVVYGLIRLFLNPPAGLLVMGAGCIIISVGLFFTIATLWITVKVIPWMVKGITGLCKKLFSRKGESFA